MKNKGCSYLVMAFFAIVYLYIKIWSEVGLISHYRIVNNGVKTKGYIMGLQESRGSKGSMTFAPIVEFKDTNGSNVVYYSNIFTNQNPYEVGDDVNLWYLPSNPEKAVILEGRDWW